jgi:hypothetical protein
LVNLAKDKDKEDKPRTVGEDKIAWPRPSSNIDRDPSIHIFGVCATQDAAQSG